MMKKILACLMAIMMLAVSAFAVAEEAPEINDVLDFTIVMDVVPEGYTYEIVKANEGQYVIFTPDDENKISYIVSIIYDDTCEGITLPDDINAAGMPELIAVLTEDYNDAVVTMSATSHGTPALILDENHCEGDYAEIFTIYEGYNICVIMDSDTEITAAEKDLGMKILSDMWIK